MVLWSRVMMESIFIRFWIVVVILVRLWRDDCDYIGYFEFVTGSSKYPIGDKFMLWLWC